MIHSVKKVPGVDHSKSPLKVIVKNLSVAKLAPLCSSAICRFCLVCFAIFPMDKDIQQRILSNFALQMEFRVRNR